VRHLLLLLVTPLVAVAAPVPKETDVAKMKRLFGELADAKKGYDFTLDDDKLVVKVAGGSSKESAYWEKSKLAPPRVEREVTGDFEARVQLEFAPPKGKAVAAGESPAAVAGLCIQTESGQNWYLGPIFQKSDQKNATADGWGMSHFLRKEKTELISRANQGVESSAAGDFKYQAKEKPHVTFRREGDVIKFKIGEGAKLEASDFGFKHKLGETVKVGVFVMSNATTECQATFTEFAVTPLKPAEKK